MNHQVPKFVTRLRASLMLGIPEAELNRISKESGLGHVERAENQEETYFTYEELQRICIVAANPGAGHLKLTRQDGQNGNSEGV